MSSVDAASRNGATPRLITIPISHYCERARWALDRSGLSYREERHLQGFHLRVVRRAGARRTVPVLVTADEVLTDSADIMRWVDRHVEARQRLCPEGADTEVARLDARLGTDFGVATRMVAYSWFLPHPKLLLRANAVGAPLWQKAVLRLIFPFARRELQRYLNMTPPELRRASERIDRTFDEMDERLADGRPFLCGDRLTAADVTWASLSAPVLLPQGYGVPLPPLSQLPAPIVERIEAYRSRLAGRHTLHLYATVR